MDEEKINKEKSDKSDKKERKKIDITNYVIIAVVIVAIIGFLIYNGTIPLTGFSIFNSNKVQIGDQISMNYVGRFENSTIFDTNIEDVAKKEGHYTSLRSYDPLSFVVGQGQMIKGVDNAVVGMKVGQKKQVIVKPADGYGLYDENKVQTITKIQRFNKTEEIDRYAKLTEQEFQKVFNEAPVEGKEYAVPNIPWKIRVNTIFAGIIDVESLLTPGDVIRLPNSQWDSLVLGVTKEKITILHKPKPGQKIQTSFGSSTVRLKGRYIELVFDANEGDQIQTLYGPITVKEVTNDTITVDTNHPLAGKTLYFDVEIVSVNKTK